MGKWILSVLVAISLAGCGDFEWFPDNKPSTTSPPTTSPSNFILVRKCGVDKGAPITFGPVIVSGITGSSAKIKITTNNNGQYSINGGVFTNISSRVSNDQKVTVMHTSAAVDAGQGNTLVTTTLTIGDRIGLFKSDTDPYLCTTQE